MMHKQASLKSALVLIAVMGTACSGEPRIVTGPKLVWGNDTLAGAEGTWVLQDEDIAYPVNHSKVQCWRAASFCTVFTANLELPSDLWSRVTSSYSLMTEIDVYDIVQWTTSQVEAKAAGICREATLTLNWSTGEVHNVITDIGQGCPGMLERLTKPRIATLVTRDAV